MPKTTESKGHVEGSVPFVVSVCSLIAVLFCLGFADKAATGLYFGNLYQDFSLSISASGTTKDIFSEKRFGEILPERDRFSRRLYELVGLIEKSDFKKSQEIVSGNEFPSNELGEKLESLVEDGVRVQEEVATTESHIAEVKEKLAKSSESYLQLKESTINLFHGRFPGEDSESSGADVERPGTDVERIEEPETAPIALESANSEQAAGEGFYAEGVLAGLPVLPGIPDNIPDEKGLVTYFGNLHFNQKFRRALEALKSESSMVEVTLKQSERESAESLAEFEHLTGELQDMKKEALKLSVALILDIGKTGISPAIRSAYETAARCGKGLGLDLPPLEFKPA